MSLLEYKNKFSIENPNRGATVSEDTFFRWSNKNFYRTSYNDMRTPVGYRLIYDIRNLLKTKILLFQDTKDICLE